MNKEKKEKIWRISNYIKTGIIKDGNPVLNGVHIVNIPCFENIYQDVLNNLKVNLFNVERVSPLTANCILRVFRHNNLQHEDEIHWVYGADIFIKSLDGMTSRNDCIIDYSKCEIKKWLFQDESFIMIPDFIDYYLKIN